MERFIKKNINLSRLDILYGAPKELLNKNNKEKLSTIERALKAIIDAIDSDRLRYLFEVLNSPQY